MPPRNGLCLGGRRITLIAHLFGLPRIPRLQVALTSKRTEGVLLGQLGSPAQGPSRAVLGRSGFFLEGVSVEISAVQRSRLLLLLLLVFPGASDFGPPQWWLQFWARGAFGPASRCQAHCPR